MKDFVWKFFKNHNTISSLDTKHVTNYLYMYTKLYWLYATLVGHTNPDYKIVAFSPSINVLSVYHPRKIRHVVQNNYRIDVISVGGQHSPSHARIIEFPRSKRRALTLSLSSLNPSVHPARWKNRERIFWHWKAKRKWWIACWWSAPISRTSPISNLKAAATILISLTSSRSPLFLSLSITSVSPLLILLYFVFTSCTARFASHNGWISVWIFLFCFHCSLSYTKWMRVLIFRFLVLGYSFYLIFKYRWLLWLWSLVMLFTLFCFGFFVLILFLSVQICCLLLCMFVFLCIMIIFSSISVTHHIIFRSDLYMLMDVHISWFSVTLYITLIKLYYMFVLLILVS